MPVTISVARVQAVVAGWRKPLSPECGHGMRQAYTIAFRFSDPTVQYDIESRRPAAPSRQ